MGGGGSGDSAAAAALGGGAVPSVDVGNGDDDDDGRRRRINFESGIASIAVAELVFEHAFDGWIGARFWCVVAA